jgi:hypothetical protein
MSPLVLVAGICDRSRGTGHAIGYIGSLRGSIWGLHDPEARIKAQLTR